MHRRLHGDDDRLQYHREHLGLCEWAAWARFDCPRMIYWLTLPGSSSFFLPLFDWMQDGGGLYIYDYSTVTMTGCTVTDNTASVSGQHGLVLTLLE